MNQRTIQLVEELQTFERLAKLAKGRFRPRPHRLNCLVTPVIHDNLDRFLVRSYSKESQGWISRHFQVRWSISSVGLQQLLVLQRALPKTMLLLLSSLPEMPPQFGHLIRSDLEEVASLRLPYSNLSLNKMSRLSILEWAKEKIRVSFHRTKSHLTVFLFESVYVLQEIWTLLWSSQDVWKNSGLQLPSSPCRSSGWNEVERKREGEVQDCAAHSCLNNEQLF